MLEAGPETAEEIDRVRCDVCAYKVRGLFAFERVLVASVSGSWVVVV